MVEVEPDTVIVLDGASADQSESESSFHVFGKLSTLEALVVDLFNAVEPTPQPLLSRLSDKPVVQRYSFAATAVAGLVTLSTTVATVVAAPAAGAAASTVVVV